MVSRTCLLPFYSAHCPFPYCYRGFEFLASFHSTHCPQSIPPAGGDPTYELGHVACSGINFNCHGFTEFMCQERVEYAWLMQLLVERITGAVSTEQVQQVS